MEYRSRSTTRLPTGGGGGGGGYNDSPRSRDDFLDRFDAGRAHRSRSLDLRREQDMEDEFESARNRFGSSAVVPYDRSDRNYRRPYDYDRDLELGASAGARRWEGREYGPAPGHSPRGRTGVLLGARSQEWYPKREQPSPRYRDDRSRQTTGTIVPVGQMSPRSASSRRGQGDLRVNVNAANGKDRRGGAYGPPTRKDEPSPRSGVYPPAPQAAAGYPPAPVADARAAPPPRDEYREGGRRYDQEWSAAGGGGGGYARGGHHSYHSSHQRSSGGAAAVAESSMVRRSPGFFGAIGGQKSPQAGGGWSERPRQHYKVRCCCLTFTWPPWSYEPVQPPQPIYRSPAPNQF